MCGGATNAPRSVDFVARRRLSSPDHGGRGHVGEQGAVDWQSREGSGGAFHGERARGGALPGRDQRGVDRCRGPAPGAHRVDNVVVWGKQAETCGQYLSKGRQVYVEGSIRTRQYDDKEGNRRYITEVVAQRVQFLGGGGRGAEAPRSAAAAEEPPAGPPAAAEDDDIPF